jgi:hypothetical protein
MPLVDVDWKGWVRWAEADILEKKDEHAEEMLRDVLCQSCGCSTCMARQLAATQ